MEVEKKTMKVPVELLLKLTKHLDTIELLKCRLVHSSFNCPTHYKNIRSLTCFYYHRQIKELENLESLVCHSSHDEFDPHFFKYFPRLKFLYFRCAPNHHIQLEEERVRLERNDLKIFYFGKMGREFRENIGWFRWINWSVFDCGNVFAYYYRNELDKLAPTLPTYSALHFDQSFLGYDRRFYSPTCRC